MKSTELYGILPKLRSNTCTVPIHKSPFLGKAVTEAPHIHREIESAKRLRRRAEVPTML